MKIKVNGTEYALNFGIRFVRELDLKYNQPNAGGTKLGIGLEVVLPKLMNGYVETVEEVLLAATATLEDRPTGDDLDDYIDSIPDYDKFIEQVLDELKKQNATKTRTLAVVAKQEERRIQEKAEKEVSRAMTQTPMRKPMPITK